MQTQQPRFLRLPEVIQTTGYRRASIYKKMQDGDFPPSYALGPRAVGWLSTDIDAWIGTRIGTVGGAK